MDRSPAPFNGKRFRIFILGAGFSRAAGLPLASELWSEIIRRARLLGDWAQVFQEDLESYLRYKNSCDGTELTPNAVDFEDFMAFLDIEHFLALRGKNTWSSHGNETTVMVKTLIGKILTERMPARIPDVHLQFAGGLKPGDYVLTFNYDILLERAFDTLGVPYRLFPSRYRSVSGLSATIDSSRHEIVLLKLHGSVDWFDRTQYTEREQWQQEAGLSTPPSGDPIFPHSSILGVAKLLEGPRFPGDPLDQMYRVREVEALYQGNILFSATPWLLPPSTAKLVYASRLSDFWYGMGDVGLQNFGVIIIGYSLPPQDAYARQVLYNIATNYQQTGWDQDFYGLKKRPLVLIDWCPTPESLRAFKARYRFIDWARAVLHTTGFNEEAVHLAIGQAN